MTVTSKPAAEPASVTEANVKSNWAGIVTFTLDVLDRARSARGGGGVAGFEQGDSAPAAGVRTPREAVITKRTVQRTL
jgi:hypothetical protein